MMTPEIRAFIETVSRQSAQQPSRHPPRMEFSKKLMLGALIYAAIFCAVSTAAWFVLGDWPREIADKLIWPFVGIASYNFKTAYENRAKIENGKDV